VCLAEGILDERMAVRQGLVRDKAERRSGFSWMTNGGQREKHRKWSPVKGACQEVGGRVDPAHAVCDGADACDSFVRLVGWTLLLR